MQRKEYYTQYYLENKERIKARDEANRDKIREKNKAYREKNKTHLYSQQKLWKEANPDRVAGYFLSMKFGLTIEQYNKMLADQQFCCYICNTHVSQLKKRLAVDHCHDSGQIRKLLCEKCNRGIGLLQDNSQLLRKASDYLRSFEEV